MGQVEATPGTVWSVGNNRVIRRRRNRKIGQAVGGVIDQVSGKALRGAPLVTVNVGVVGCAAGIKRAVSPQYLARTGNCGGNVVGPRDCGIKNRHVVAYADMRGTDADIADGDAIGRVGAIEGE